MSAEKQSDKGLTTKTSCNSAIRKQANSKNSLIWRIASDNTNTTTSEDSYSFLQSYT